MILRALFLLLFGIGAAHAQTARVVSGEHESFTRLVVELPGPTNWTVGRLRLGYGFAVVADNQPTYDLAKVWDRIPQTRLQSVRVDPADGVLRLTLACDCHVFPFEFQPGMIVLDIKDGPPPSGSSFEGPLTLAFASDVPIQPNAEGYDWLSTREKGGEKASANLVLPTGKNSLDPLRDELLAQISRGAAEGLVDMALPGKPLDHQGGQWGELPWTTIRLGEGTGIEIRPGDDDSPLSSGAECFPDDQLDLSSWASNAAPSDLLSQARRGLYGEFDQVSAESVLQAVRVHLYLGFGAEARGYADLMIMDPPDSLAFYRSMSRLVDGETDAASPFTGMLGCDGPAALWAALASDHLVQGPEVNRDAILRSLVALPPHLRRHLGPKLADKFLAHDDRETARVIRDAIERTPQADPASVALMDAKSDLSAGENSAAQSHAEAAVAATGDDADSLITLVQAHFQNGTPLQPEVSVTLRTLLREAEGRADEPDLRRAMILALALSGDIDAAFAESDGQTEAIMDMWSLLPQRASDDAFLTHAILSDAEPAPLVDDATAELVAERLLGLGFADAALQWLGSVEVNDPPNRRRLAAGAELARGDARSAVRLLAGIDDPKGQELRAKALIELGDLSPAEATLRSAGLEEDADRLLTWTQDWADVSTLPESNWANAAALVDVAAPTDGAGLLGQGAQLLADSAAMREAVTALLSTVPPPSE